MARPGETLPNIALAHGCLDRRADRRGDADLIATLLADPATRVLDLVGGAAPLDDAGGPAPDEGEVAAGGCRPGLRFRPPEASDRDRLAWFLGEDPSEPGAVAPAYVAVWRGREGAEPPAGYATLRSVGAALSDRDAGMFATSLGLANWHRTHTHCPRCGTATVPTQSGWVRRCPADGSQHFPRTDPAVIMAVVDADDRLLLARGAGFRTGGMSVLAGFVEPGESLAGAVAREVAEEVGLAVTDVTYLGDQPWPFPSSLMVGFTARVEELRDLRLQTDEIAAARWFTRAELLEGVADGSVILSPRLSIARRLIEDWYGAPIDVPGQSLRVSRGAS